MTSAQSIHHDLTALADPKQASLLSRFFKTQKGEYGYGDQFLGLKVPVTRKVVKQHQATATLEDVDQLLQSPLHEERLAAVLIMVYFAKQHKYPLDKLAKFYMQHADRINNWDLVDLSAGHVIGPYVTEFLSDSARKKFISSCVNSSHLWTNRIIVLASFYAIYKGQSELTLQLAQQFLTHKHDLMHKAVGWMLREVGKRVSEQHLTNFLDEYSKVMPRTMLRYAIERLSPKQRAYYMQK